MIFPWHEVFWKNEFYGSQLLNLYGKLLSSFNLILFFIIKGVNNSATDNTPQNVILPLIWWAEKGNLKLYHVELERYSVFILKDMLDKTMHMLFVNAHRHDRRLIYHMQKFLTKQPLNVQQKRSNDDTRRNPIFFFS